MASSSSSRQLALVIAFVAGAAVTVVGVLVFVQTLVDRWLQSHPETCQSRLPPPDPRLSALQAQVAACTQERDACQTGSRGLQEELTTVLGQRDGLQADLDRCRANAQLPSGDQCQGSLEACQRDYGGLQGAHQALQDDQAALSAGCTSLRGSYEVLQTDHAALQGTYTQLRGDHAALQDGYAKLRDEYDALSGGCTTLRATYDGLQTDHAALQGTYTQLRGDYEALSGGCATLQGTYDRLQGEYGALGQQAAACTATLGAFRTLSECVPLPTAVAPTPDGCWLDAAYAPSLVTADAAPLVPGSLVSMWLDRSGARQASYHRTRGCEVRRGGRPDAGKHLTMNSTTSFTMVTPNNSVRSVPLMYLLTTRSSKIFYDAGKSPLVGSETTGCTVVAVCRRCHTRGAWSFLQGVAVHIPGETSRCDWCPGGVSTVDVQTRGR